MSDSVNMIEVYLEAGDKRTFAGALEWPGWCRGGRDEASALQALYAYAPRYARVIGLTPLAFAMPAEVAALTVVEWLKGDASTDFGAPGAIPAADARPVDEAELQRLQTALQACWQTLDAAVEAASGRELRKGPRGGGRDLAAIRQHVLDAEAGYLSRLGRKVQRDAGEDPAAVLVRARQAVLKGLAAAAHGEVPAQGPRGGARWPARYFARRVAWHVLDHAWEIEDRVI